MLKRLEELFGVDLGTCNTLIYQQKKGIVLSEPSVVAIQTDTGEIKAFGQEAYNMIGRTPANVEVIYPLKDGVIANFDMTLAMLKVFYRQNKKRLSMVSQLSSTDLCALWNNECAEACR